MAIIIMDRFDDPNLTGWTVDVGSNNSIKQVTETVTGAITYTRTKVVIDVKDTTQRAYMYRNIGKRVRKGAIQFVFKAPSEKPSGRIQLVGAGTWDETRGIISESITVGILDNGNLDVNGKDTGIAICDGNVHRVTLYYDIDRNWARIIVDGTKEYELTDLYTSPSNVPDQEYVDIGTSIPNTTYTIEFYFFAFADDYPNNPKYTIDGIVLGYGVHRAVSFKLGIYAIAYRSNDGYVRVMIRRIDDDALVKDINTNIPIEYDIGHQNMSTYFVDWGDRVDLYVVVRMHNTTGKLIRIDTSTWNITTADIPAGTYAQLVPWDVDSKQIAIIQREGGTYPEHLYVRIYDRDLNYINGFKIVNAGSGIAIYPIMVGVDKYKNYVVIAWAYYDSNVGRRYGLYMLLYDMKNKKYISVNGVEKSIPVEYNDNDLKIADETQPYVIVLDKIYVGTSGGYDPEYVKIYKVDPESKTVTAIYDGSEENVTSADWFSFVTNGTNHYFGLAPDYDNAVVGTMRPAVLYPEFPVPSWIPSFVDLGNRLLIFVPDVNKTLVFERQWSNDYPYSREYDARPTEQQQPPQPPERQQPTTQEQMINIQWLIMLILLLFILEIIREWRESKKKERQR